jgi:hypothetical protein
MQRIAFTALAMILVVPAVAQTKPVIGPQAGPPPKPSTPPTTAKGAPVNGVLVLYGNERCPTDANGAEIVICEHRNAQEQFRVPKELREFKVTPENESWARRAEGTLDTGASGIGSCSAIGPGGSIGCTQQAFRRAKKENQDRIATDNEGKDSK